MQRAEIIDLHHATKRINWQVVQIAGMRKARSVDQKIGDAEMLNDVPQPALYRVKVDNIHGKRRDSLILAKASLLHGRLSLSPFGAIPRTDKHVGTVGCQSYGNG
jgi:hypothetical protein